MVKLNCKSRTLVIIGGLIGRYSGDRIGYIAKFVPSQCAWHLRYRGVISFLSQRIFKYLWKLSFRMNLGASGNVPSIFDTALGILSSLHCIYLKNLTTLATWIIFSSHLLYFFQSFNLIISTSFINTSTCLIYLRCPSLFVLTLMQLDN